MRLKWYGWLGLAWVLVAQVLMFLQVQPFWRWFTPIVWTGYILFEMPVDRVVANYCQLYIPNQFRQ